ncbi:MAG: magnesium transporter [Anaerolineaceae bacterium]|nr:magnesium transporter [Anaerolineaceae bacterium]
MLEIYRSNSENHLELLDDIVDGCWVNCIDPTTDEIERLTYHRIPLDFITDPLDVDERPRTEREDDGTVLIILRIPYFEGALVDVPYSTISLGIVITEHFVVTICRRKNELIERLKQTKMRGFSTSKRVRFLLHILLSSANKYLNYLHEIDNTVDRLEDKLQISLNNKDLLELLKYQKSLVYFATALRTNELMMERLQRSQIFLTYPDDEDLLEDVITEIKQAREMVSISSDILKSMTDSFASIISNNLNDVVKVLTSVTIILSIPTIVTSFFGMNFSLPFEQFDFAYWIVIGISIGLAAVTTILFVWRKWF